MAVDDPRKVKYIILDEVSDEDMRPLLDWLDQHMTEQFTRCAGPTHSVMVAKRNINAGQIVTAEDVKPTE